MSTFLLIGRTLSACFLAPGGGKWRFYVRNKANSIFSHGCVHVCVCVCACALLFAHSCHVCYTISSVRAFGFSLGLGVHTLGTWYVCGAPEKKPHTHNKRSGWMLKLVRCVCMCEQCCATNGASGYCTPARAVGHPYVVVAHRSKPSSPLRIIAEMVAAHGRLNCVAGAGGGDMVCVVCVCVWCQFHFCNGELLRHVARVTCPRVALSFRVDKWACACYCHCECIVKYGP